MRRGSLRWSSFHFDIVGGSTCHMLAGPACEPETNRKRARNNLEYLQSGTGLLNKKEFDARTISLFESLEPGLVNYLKNAVNPDNTLENFVRIIKTKKFPSIWYTEFKKKTFFKKFLFICEFNQRAVDLMVINKILPNDLTSCNCLNWHTEGV